jgi:hypothetical protein
MNLDKIIGIVRKLNEEVAIANSASGGGIAGLPPDQPPVKKKKKYIYCGKGSRKMWM